MKKSILLRVEPEQVVKILYGEKTLELQKRVPKDFVGWVYIYVTKGSKGIYFDYLNKEWFFFGKGNVCNGTIHNGKVVARFWFDSYTKYTYDNYPLHSGYEEYTGEWVDTTETVEDSYNITSGDLKRLCLNYEEVEKFGKSRPLYAWHIKQLEIFYTPKELSNFYVLDDEHIHDDSSCLTYWKRVKISINKGPQFWQYVWTD